MRCHERGETPGCLDIADESYTMHFDDIGEAPIYWCSACGPVAHDLNAKLVRALRADPSFAKKLEKELDGAEAKGRS